MGNGGLEYYYSKRTANSRLAILCEKVAKMIFRKTRCCTNQLESDYTCVTWWERRGLRGQACLMPNRAAGSVEVLPPESRCVTDLSLAFAHQ